MTSYSYQLNRACADCRSDALQVVLDAASGEHADTRNKAVRLIANKLFAQPQLQDSIESFARQMLFRLTATAPAAAATAEAPPPAASSLGQSLLPTPATTATAPSPAILSTDQSLPLALPAPTTTPTDPQPSSSQQQLQYQSEEEGTQFSGLYCALCTKKQALLQDLLLVYGRAAEDCKSAIEAVAAGSQNMTTLIHSRAYCQLFCTAHPSHACGVGFLLS